MDRLLSMRVFTRVVDAGSFAGASRELDMNQAVVTRLVADLEHHLGARLLMRTTRSMHLTDAGADYLQRCRSILAEVESAEAIVTQGHEQVAGTVRLALPLLFGMDVLAARLKEFRKRYPAIVLEVALLDRPVDLINEGFDLAVTSSLTMPVNGSAVARPMFEMVFALCASPDYLKTNPAPKTPEALANHDVVGAYQSVLGKTWSLTNDRGVQKEVPVNVVFWAGDMRLAQEAVRAGVGIGVVSRRAIGLDEAQGLLVPVLPAWHIGTLSFSLLYPGREFVPARVRAVIDFILSDASTTDR